jgi:hypothetical protein
MAQNVFSPQVSSCKPYGSQITGNSFASPQHCHIPCPLQAGRGAIVIKSIVHHQHHNGSHCNSNSFLIKTSVRVCVWLCFVGADLGWLEKGMNSESVDYLTHKCRAKPLSPACARDGQAELAGQSGSEHEASSSLPQSTLRAYVYSSHTPATWPLALRMKESSCTRNMMQGD